MWTSARGIVRAVSVGLGATLPYGTMRRIQPAGRYRKSKTATGTRAARLSGRSLHERLRIWWTVSPTGCWLWNGATPSPPATRATAATGAHVHTCVAFGSSRCVDPVSSGGARQAWVMVRSADRMLSRPSRAPGCLARTTQGRTRPG